MQELVDAFVGMRRRLMEVAEKGGEDAEVVEMGQEQAGEGEEDAGGAEVDEMEEDFVQDSPTPPLIGKHIPRCGVLRN